MDARHAPVDPLPFVPAMSTPVMRRSGLPSRSRIAVVRSVPSFIAKRPCFEMYSSASSYLTRDSGGHCLDRAELPIEDQVARHAKPRCCKQLTVLARRPLEAAQDDHHVQVAHHRAERVVWIVDPLRHGPLEEDEL